MKSAFRQGQTLRFRLATVIIMLRVDRNILFGICHLYPIPFTDPIKPQECYTMVGGSGRYHQFYIDTTMYTTTASFCNCSVLVCGILII